MNTFDKNTKKLRNASKHLMMQDINTIYNFASYIKSKQASVFIMGILPYLTACVDSAIEFLEKAQIDLSHLSLMRDYAQVTTKTRAKIKMYRERTGKNIGVIETIREEKNEEFEKMLRFPFLKEIKANYDLGTYILDGQYIGNSFLYEWFFDEINKIEAKNPHFDFSRALGEATAYIKNMRKTNKRTAGSFDFGSMNYKDYNVTHRPDELFINGLDKGQSLFLFNLLLNAINLITGQAQWGLCALSGCAYLGGASCPEVTTIENAARLFCFRSAFAYVIAFEIIFVCA